MDVGVKSKYILYYNVEKIFLKNLKKHLRYIPRCGIL